MKLAAALVAVLPAPTLVMAQGAPGGPKPFTDNPDNPAITGTAGGAAASLFGPPRPAGTPMVAIAHANANALPPPGESEQDDGADGGRPPPPPPAPAPMPLPSISAMVNETAEGVVNATDASNTTANANTNATGTMTGTTTSAPLPLPTGANGEPLQGGDGDGEGDGEGDESAAWAASVPLGGALGMVGVALGVVFF